MRSYVVVRHDMDSCKFHGFPITIGKLVDPCLSKSLTTQFVVMVATEGKKLTFSGKFELDNYRFQNAIS